MPFDEEEELEIPQKIAIKKVSSQKSIFDSHPKKPSKEDLEKRVQDYQDKDFTIKTQAAELTAQFKKMMADKTLKKNKSIFAAELEQELLSKMIDLGIKINDDPDQKHESMGSMSWIILLFRTCLYQRDRINELEFTLSQIDKKINATISKEISARLDNKKVDE